MNTVIKTWTTDGQLRPPVAYHGHLVGLGGIRGMLYSSNGLRRYSPWTKLVRIAVPTVHASSAPDDGSVTESKNTTVDVLAESRGNIVITENDILAVLEKETGRDRLRVMYSKE